jgi:uncharacterized protein (UPF0248 family)
VTENPLRDFLNRIRWDPATEAEEVVLAVELRAEGRPSVEEVPFARIGEILPGGVELRDGTFLPYHRVVSVQRRGEWLWRREAGS